MQPHYAFLLLFFTEDHRTSDGRFSETHKGFSVGHISPKAADAAPFAIVREGDQITIDMKVRTLHLHARDEEIEGRRS